MKTIAIVLAAGTGSRFGSDEPKQFAMLDGRPVVLHSVDLFCSSDDIDEVAVVTHPRYRDRMAQLLDDSRYAKVTRLIDGGDERYLSSLNALAALLDEPDDTSLLFHDAARPWLSAALLTKVVEALRHHEAVGVAVPSTDTVWEVRQVFEPQLGKVVARIPERNTMYLAQTPQAFRLPVIRDAYQRALQDPMFRATDDCGVVRRYMPEIPIHVVEGEQSNRKITFPSDI